MPVSAQSDHRHYMQLALQAAKHALPQDVPVGAVLVHQGKILATACNRREFDQNPVGHAEMLVIQEAAQKLNNWRLSNTILYVTLEPCPMCASAIQQARIPHVVFGAYDPVMGACGSRYQLLETTQATGGILEAPCSQLLKDFFKGTRT